MPNCDELGIKLNPWSGDRRWSPPAFRVAEASYQSLNLFTDGLSVSSTARTRDIVLLANASHAVAYTGESPPELPEWAMILGVRRLYAKLR